MSFDPDIPYDDLPLRLPAADLVSTRSGSSSWKTSFIFTGTRDVTVDPDRYKKTENV